MSKLLGTGPLTMESTSPHRPGSGTVMLSSHGKRQYVCVKCHDTFLHYKGVKGWGRGGLGLCKGCNPHYHEATPPKE